MPKYAIYVSETVNHMYVVEANSAEEAEAVYYSYDDDQLKSEDSDGSVGWDSPWEVALLEEEYYRCDLNDPTPIERETND